MMKKSLYLECNSGISGDMTVAALLDVGADKEVLQEALESLELSGAQIHISRVKKAGLDCCDFDVQLDKEHENHDHDMEYLHGHHRQEEHGSKEHRQHVHRGIQEINEIIAKANITQKAKEIAGRIFWILAEAEAKAHGVLIEQVHFHEVGAVDSIIDIVAAAVCIDNLGIEDIIVTQLKEGTGTIRCQHGMLPIPVPATANIIAKYEIPIRIGKVNGELVTPTGAAIVAAVTTSHTLPDAFVIRKIGLGAGKRNYETPSILRAMILEAEEKKIPDNAIIKIESNIDDCSGEVLGYTLEKLMQAGALDVSYFPIYMKKNRPAWQLQVLCAEEKEKVITSIIFKETTTIGIRRMKIERTILHREQKEIDTKYGKMSVKVCEYDGVKKVYPEYECIRKFCQKTGKSYQELYHEVYTLGTEN